MTSALAPVQAQQRIRNIDAIRGVAVLGILAMNIVGFAFHPAVYGDPTIAGGAQGVNLWVFIVNAFLVDGKMRGMFTLLFGAGVILLTSRAEERGGGIGIADIYYRRTLWLLLFGLLHAYLLWWGEVLYPYALLGLLLFPFRKLSASRLLSASAVLCALMIGGGVYDAWDTGKQLEKYNAAMALKKQNTKLTDEQQSDISKWEEKLKFMKPDAAALKKNHDLNVGGFNNNVKARAEIVGFFHRQPIYSPILWDLLVMMLAGMALLKTGVLTGERSTAFYAKLAAASYLIGFPLHAVQVWIQMNGWFSIVSSTWAGVFYEPARIAVTLGHIAVWMLVFKHGILPWLSRSLAATGQMALTNYLMQSVICTLIFNVVGLHESFQRYQIYYVVAAIWAVELIWSPIWLSRFRFGPAEWLWRSLTYWQPQPMRMGTTEPEVGGEQTTPLPAES